MHTAALALGALLLGAPAPAPSPAPEAAPAEVAAPDAAAPDEAPPVGWDRLSPAQQERLANTDPATL